MSEMDVENKEVSNDRDTHVEASEEDFFKKPTDVQSDEFKFKKPNTVTANDHAFKVPKTSLALHKKSSKQKSTTSNTKTGQEVELSSSKTATFSGQDGNETVVKKLQADNLNDNEMTLPYKEPSWSSICNESYNFEILKNGVINSSVELTGKPFVVFGRLTNCDGVLQHPSISRYHAIVQFKADIPNKHNDGTSSGCYLYDLGSTHGTFLNKVLVKPKVFYRIKVGHMIKFGKSTRIFILQGPDSDQEEEAEETVTELVEKRKEFEQKLNLLEDEEESDKNFRSRDENSATLSTDDAGVDWGMGEDAVEETDLSVNPYALSTPNEEAYFEDPKKTLRGYFEREGCELEYNVEEKGYSQFICKIELPIDSPTGQPVYAEASVKGKKKEAVIQCALEACRILDRQGLLRQSQHKSRKRKGKNWEEDDFYDSDEDTFLDRTGTVEKKRWKRMEKANVVSAKAETYETLQEQLKEVQGNIDETESSLATSAKDVNMEDDSLEAYMDSVKAGVLHDKKAISAMKIQLSQLRLEKSKLEKLVSIAKPTVLPLLAEPKEMEVQPKPRKQLPMIGSMRGGQRKFRFLSAAKKPPTTELKNSTSHDNPVPKISESNESLFSKKCPFDAPDSEGPSEDIGDEKEHTLSPKFESRMPALDDQMADNSDKDEGVSKTPVDDDNKIELREMNYCEGIKKRDKKRKHKIFKAREKMAYCYDDTNPDYAMWMPPENQVGDGKTQLNDKYGY